MTKEKIERVKRGKPNSEFYQVKYLPRAHMIAILDEANFRILSRELEFQQEITLKSKKEKICMFCLNMGVYRASQTGALQAQTDQICVATSEKMLYFFDTVYTPAGGCQF